jgi:hypothetical protein
MRAPTLVLLVLLSACESGGGGGDDDTIGPINCADLTGATADSAVTCAGGCGGDFAEAAVDRDLSTYAILQLSQNAAGSLSIRATAADGVIHPAGTPAAIVYGITRSAGDSVNTVRTISTYLDGTLQEANNVVTNGATSGDVDAGRNTMETHLPFDAIEFTYSQSGGTAAVEVQAYEFCTSAN